MGSLIREPSISPRRKFMAGEPMNPATNRFTGLLVQLPAAMPSCCTTPRRMRAIRSPRVMASVWSWVT